MSEEKRRHTVWLTDGAWAEVQKHYKEDTCSTLNEYIEKAIRFYSAASTRITRRVTSPASSPGYWTASRGRWATASGGGVEPGAGA